MTLRIRPLKSNANRAEPARIPIEWLDFTPERAANLTLDQIKQLPIQFGNSKRELGSLFEIFGSSKEQVWQLTGDFTTVHWIGHAMTEGRIEIEGSVGRHLGSGMRGGEIQVAGSAGDWVGAEMHGGTIRIKGDSGNHAGGAYVGSPTGMRGGTLTIHGNAGNEIGRAMRRGLIAVGGRVGDLLGLDMKAGTILVKGQVGRRAGAGMRRGTLCLLQPDDPCLLQPDRQLKSRLAAETGETIEAQTPPEGNSGDNQQIEGDSADSLPAHFKLLPTFRGGFRGPASFWPLLYRELRTQQFPLQTSDESNDFEIYHGDLLYEGRGELLVKKGGPSGIFMDRASGHQS